ncbi:hypothetical protein Dda_2079 [Drechslerella dactyloides]|uniref:SWIM-type domain-containing protein n=1 Tax=Drechslerella dactyloides TaxID=74499 RepID=A0AAD6NMN0_DREDA|nr:hypothetical protein Dda_2079 [Drechslerella dactyloides]
MNSTLSLESMVDVDISSSGPRPSDISSSQIEGNLPTRYLTALKKDAVGYSTRPILREHLPQGELVDIHLQGFTTVKDYDSPHDPRNPQSWSKRKKWYCIFVIGMMCFINNVGASVISLALLMIAEDFNTSRTVATLGLSLYVFGLGIGPMLSAPLSEQFGRKKIYKVSYTMFLFVQLPTALGPPNVNLGAWLFFRLMGGVFASPGPAVFPAPARALPMLVFVASAFSGAAFGPVLSGIIISHHDWCWTLWVTMILSACLFPFIYFMPETYQSTILDKDVQNRQLHGERVLRPDKEKLEKSLWFALSRPVTLLVTEPIVLLFSIYSGFVYMLLYGFTSSLPYIFSTVYSFSTVQSGLPFLAICLGITLTVPIYLFFFEPLYTQRPFPVPPEARLPSMVPPAIAMVVALFLFAWTAGLGVHWAVPIIAVCIFGYAALGLFVPHIAYITDCYPIVAASVSGANGLLRYTMGCMFPLISRTSVKWSMTILGGIAALMLPLPLIFMRYGALIRQHGKFSRYALCIEVEMPEHDELAEINGVRPKVLLKDGEVRDVKSESQGSTRYTIKRTYDHFYCTCPGWRINGGPVNGRTCKHLKSLLGEAYERERVEQHNPSALPAGGRKSTATDKKKRTATGNVRDRKRKASDNDEDDDAWKTESDEAEEQPRRKPKRSKVKEEESEEEELSFSELDTMDEEQLRAEKSIMMKRLEKVITLLAEAKSKGKGRAAPPSSMAKVKRTITGKAPRRKPASDNDDEGEDGPSNSNDSADVDEDEDDEDLEAPQPPNSKLRPQLLLAEKWDQQDGIDPTNWWMSEKLDGVRAYWNGSTFLSREGNKFYAPDWFTRKFPTDVTLDGELTCGRGRFIDTVSIVKTANAADRWKFSVEYHVFDVPSLGNQRFEDRQEYLRKLLDRSRIRWVKHVEQTQVKDKDHVLEELERITDVGGEGLMLREPRSRYVQKRSRTCLKVKTFHDAEAKVIGHEPGKGRNLGRCGALRCEMMDASAKKFKVGTGLDDKMRKDPPKVGTIITYRYFELTKDGVPRFPSFMRVFKGH